MGFDGFSEATEALAGFVSVGGCDSLGGGL
jgi:hypothetical protein